MAEQRGGGPAGAPGGPGGRAGQDDDYDWLYAPREGAATSDFVPDRADPDATQVIRRDRSTGWTDPSADQPTRAVPAYRSDERDSAALPPPPVRIAPTPGTGRGPDPTPAPGAGAPGGSSLPARSRRRPRVRLGRVLLLAVLLVVAWLAYLVGVPIYALQQVRTAGFDPGGDRPADQPGTTYLVVGSDARKGLAGQRTDTIMLLHTGSGPNLLLSLPRDSQVEVPGHGVTKINAAFAYGGPKLLVQTVEGATGIRVDDYVEIGFTGFVKLVDAVGGVRVCPESAMKDPLADLDIRAGCQDVDGTTALGYARSRHTQNLGDIGRAQHQREVVSAIGDKIVSPWTVLNPWRYWGVVTGGARTVRLGKGTGPVDAAKFASAMTHVSGRDGLTCTVPIADLDVHWDPTRSKALFQLIRDDETADVGKDLCTASGLGGQ